MPDLANRREHEAALAAALLNEFEAFRRSGQRNSASASWSALGVAIEEAARPLLSAIFQDAAAALAGEQGIDQAEGIAAQADAWAATRATELSRQIVDTTIETIAGRESLDGVLGSPRAEQIAITETTRAISAGEELIALILLQMMQTELVPIWHTERDERVCPICRPLHGTGKEVYGRISPSGPPAHPNCRCWLDYETKQSST